MGTNTVYQGVRAWETSRNQQLFSQDCDDNQGRFIATDDAWDGSAYGCPMCQRSFDHLNTLQSHFDSGVHDSNAAFMCRGCGREFRRMSHLRQPQETSNKQPCRRMERLGSLLINDFQRSANPTLMITNNSHWTSNPECTLRFDGAARGTTGYGSAGFVLLDHRGHEIAAFGVEINYAVTSNQAEYIGMIEGLQYALDSNVRDVVVRGDSELVVNQMKGVYGVESYRLIPLYNVAKGLERRFRRCSFEWIPREQNGQADALAKAVLQKTYGGIDVIDAGDYL